MVTSDGGQMQIQSGPAGMKGNKMSNIFNIGAELSRPNRLRHDGGLDGPHPMGTTCGQRRSDAH